MSYDLKAAKVGPVQRCNASQWRAVFDRSNLLQIECKAYVVHENGLRMISFNPFSDNEILNFYKSEFINLGINPLIFEGNSVVLTKEDATIFILKYGYETS